MSFPFAIKLVHSGTTLTYPLSTVMDSNDLYMDMYNVDDESTVITLANWYHAKVKTGLSMSHYSYAHPSYN
uniref:Uncharacterized protein n=1 Tax=Moniliophthora roreri TaxID=221103 RepID=A0A0W0FIB1_MONRR